MKNVDNILQSYKQQFSALCEQRNFATEMCEQYANNLSGKQIDTPNFFSLDICKDFAMYCRQYLKFFELRERCINDIETITHEMDVIKDLNGKQGS